METRIRSYEIIDRDQVVYVERAGDAWLVRGGVIDVLEQNGRTAMYTKQFPTAEAAQTAAADVLTALNTFLDAADAAAAA